MVRNVYENKDLKALKKVSFREKVYIILNKEEKAMLKKSIMIALDIITSIMLALKIESLVDYLTYMHTLTLLGLSEGDYLYYESSFGIISDVYRSLPYILIFGGFVLYILNITWNIL